MRIARLILLLLVTGPTLETWAADPDATLPVHRLTVRERGRTLSLSLVLFSAEKHRLRVIDNTDADGRARYSDLREAMKSERCLAGSNGGFFRQTPFSPVGYMIADGRPTGTFDASLWMKGLVVVRGNRMALEHVAEFDVEDSAVTHLLQSGPWLVRAGKPELDNDRARHASRTFIGHDARGTWLLGVSDSCSLQELAGFLRHETVQAVIVVEDALNLDGGPSTGMWSKGVGFDFYRPEDWTVRNFIGVSHR